MRDNDGRKADHATLEQMRFRAVDAVEAGAHPEDVAKMLGMHAKTVYGWLARAREGGRDALKAKPVPGRPPKAGRKPPAPALHTDRRDQPAPAQFGFEPVDPGDGA
ncbi:helix-turn-helix domain-containing protein [Georgenia sp. TF02-10]|uniref:helix-turn-helix domain-containing protein n=1 Tax=Georgenia sp. TF02-10 TaxID=2917725 RepID=UPI001FA6FF4A|nr:helix-turn-helix domain-containing protein [Georgenia sp. TF02-10]UNX53753.1 helix-turn-helix domain-containing protein [Georgenia sp. TF02-10]